jgi:hypothetical protein
METLCLHADAFHADWNYELRPAYNPPNYVLEAVALNVTQPQLLMNTRQVQSRERHDHDPQT